MEDEISFAYRCWQIIPDGLPSNKPWPEYIHRDQPKPPQRWRKWGYSRGWHSWKGGKRLSENQVMARQAFSIAWCQRTQQYWVVPGDCTEWNESVLLERWEKWATLYCHHLQDRGKPGLWQLLDHGETRQHESLCPPDFDEFLPKNFFMGTRPGEPCHFVGHLSLILGLLAMCPGDIDNISRQIDRIFYYDNKPRFMPWKRYSNDQTASSPNRPMDRLRYPARAIVMQTGLIRNDPRSREERLRAWERGERGPLVSSENPTEAEKQVWGI